MYIYIYIYTSYHIRVTERDFRGARRPGILTKSLPMGCAVCYLRHSHPETGGAARSVRSQTMLEASAPLHAQHIYYKVVSRS